MENFLANFIKQRLLICIVFALCFIAGIISFNKLSIDAFPDLTNNQVQILSEAPGMASIEVEQLVTIPIESLMNGLPGVEEVRSVSKFGLSVITVVFKDDVSTYFARQLVNERLQSAKSQLPDTVSSELGPITTGMGEIYQYVIEGHGYSAMELKTLHDWDIKYQLRTVPGVNEINTWGGFTQEYQVVISPERLLSLGITIKDVYEALRNNNENFSGGIIENNSEQYIVRGLGRINALDEIGQILIKKQGSAPIPINQIATLRYGAMLRQGAVTKDGQGEVVTGIVMMLKGENSRDVIKRVKEKISGIKKSLAEGVHIHPFYDQTELVEQTVKTVEHNLIEGGLLVIAVLLFMLGNLRASLIVAAAIPISLMFSFIGMKFLGIGANIMSLGALDFGMIVDGSIVMVENTMRRLAHDGKRTNTLTIVQESLKEMARPIVFGVLIITVVYMPILALEGMEYKMFSPMVFTVCFALLGSLLTALTLVPVLCSLFLRGKIEEKDSIIIQKVQPKYFALLEKAMHNRAQTVLLACLLFVLATGSLFFIGTEFVPKLDEGDLIVETRNLPSISLSEVTKVTTRMEKVIMRTPEVVTVVSKTGRPDLATDAMSVYQTDVFVKLKPKSKWRWGFSKNKIVEEISKHLNEEVPGTNFNFTQPIAMRVDELVSGVRSEVAIKLFGDDTDILSSNAEKIAALVRKVKGVADLQVEQLSGSLQVLITPNRANMALYGVNIADIRTVVETAIMGLPTSEVIDGRKRFAIKLKLANQEQLSVDKIGQLLVETTSGNRIPIAQVATIEATEGLEVVNRESGQRRIIIQCNVRGRDVGSFVKESQRLIDKSIKLPSGYYITWGGQFENQERAMKKLMLVVPLSILIIFFLLMATFNSARYALLVMLNVPFAIIGGVIALWLRGLYLSVPACIGFIALFGVAVLNGLVLITYINQLRDEGEELYQAVKLGVEARLRPVLMTALVAALGFLPMALSAGSGAEIQRPLATVVIGGLISSTLLTMVVLPVLYTCLEEEGGLRRLYQDLKSLLIKISSKGRKLL